MDEEPKVTIEIRPLQDWIKEARELMSKAKEQGLTDMEDMNPEDREKLERAMSIIRAADIALEKKQGFDVMSPREADIALGRIMDKWYAQGVQKISDIPNQAERDRAAVLLSLLSKRRVGF